MKEKTASYKTHFYRKILIWLFLGVFFLMLLVSFGTFYVYFRYYVNGLADSALQSTAYVRADLNTQLENVTLLTDNMYLETEIQEILTGPQGNNQARMQRYYSGQIAPNPYFMYQIDLFDLQGNRYIYANSATIAHSFLAGSFADEWGPGWSRPAAAFCGWTGARSRPARPICCLRCGSSRTPIPTSPWAWRWSA